ncbi:MAG: DUF4838 domain-containing protein [Thermoguttaceae bacterium]|nr:DUF4838 domain-containing protein [Thermoguttaceae bacterium]
MRFASFIGAAAMIVAATTAGRAEDTLRLVDSGEPRATVVVPEDADAQTAAAAELLVQYIERASGAKLPIQPDGKPLDGVAVHVGLTRYARALDRAWDELDADGFIIRADPDGHVLIAGPTAWGTEFGVCEFLERYVGVRWLMPGPHGDDVPERKTIELPAGEVREEPAFFSRQMSGFRGGAQATWTRRLRMHGRVQFHHNLQRLFAPETYTKTHPHFFPLRKGERYLPPNSQTHGWQPCFAAEGIEDEAVKNIIRYFDENPDATSYSLGVVDSSGHCECEACQALDTGELNFLGRRDVSDRYYGWCNRVVERVLEKHPGKTFGCLAYSEVAQPPSKMQVHESIVPFMTYDRMKWIHDGLRSEGEQMTRHWHATSPVLGWYDYIYGVSYCVPRVWFHHMADYYRFGHANGVRAMYAEAYPNFGEGPKLYVALKLMWDPGQDVDALLREWYERMVGPDAADDLAAYYAHWEDFWTRRILDSNWFTERGQYLAFHSPGYLADVTDDDVAKSRQWMESVMANTRTEQQRARAEVLMLAWEYYEASAVAHSADRMARELALETEADALAALQQAERCLAAAERRVELLMDEFPKHPALEHSLTFERRPRLRGEGWGTALVWRLFDWVKRSEAVRAAAERMAESPRESVAFHAKALLRLADEDLAPISTNPSFESEDGARPAEWSIWLRDGVGAITSAPEAARTGGQGLLCRGIRRGGPHQTLDVEPGHFAGVAHIRVPAPVAAGATATLSLTPLDDQGRNLPSLSTTVDLTESGWTQLAVAGPIPAELSGRAVRKVRLIVIFDSLEPDDVVYLDDVKMVRIGDLPE